MRRASILLPFRDAEATLAEAIESLLVEDEDFEVLAIDDGSRDASSAVAEEIASRDRRVRVIGTEPHGLVAALNRGLDEARSDVVVRMDADDRSHAPRIARSISALSDLSLGLVGTQVEILSTAVPGEGLVRYVAWQADLLEPDDHAREVFVESPLCHPTFAMRTETLRSLGGYRDGPFPEDYDLVLRVHRAGLAMRKLPFVGLSWRHREGRLTFRDPRYSVDAFRELKVTHLLPILEGTGRPTVVWGAGRDGRRFARSMLARGASIDRFVDIDPKKIGRTAHGRPIVAGADLPDPAEAFVVVAVGTAGARALIRAELLARGFRDIVDFRSVA